MNFIQLTQQTNFDKLIDNVYQTHCLLQQTAQKAVNHFLVIKNWMTGFYIIVVLFTERISKFDRHCLSNYKIRELCFLKSCNSVKYKFK